jgi:hypothetical protein
MDFGPASRNRDAMRSFVDKDLPKLSGDAPLDRRRTIVRDDESCANPRPRPLDHGAETILRRAYALAPGCPYATLSVQRGVPWGSIERALVLLGVELGWSVTLNPDFDTARDCDAVLRESELPEPWMGVARPRTGICPESR